MDTRWPSARILPAKGEMEAAHIYWDSHQCLFWLKTLLEVMASEQPEAMAIAFDLGLPTFRHEADTYKADRPGTPEDFVPDLICTSC